MCMKVILLSSTSSMNRPMTLLSTGNYLIFKQLISETNHWLRYNTWIEVNFFFYPFYIFFYFFVCFLFFWGWGQHRHGIFQKLSPWADGPNMITQCPIRPGGSYAYKFNVTGQEGTLWWHAHVSYLRATVYGPLIIRPREAYPFPKPDKETTIILGDWKISNWLVI